MVQARTREPWVIAVASQKGGVGKTTLALELAAVFADTSGRALVVDIDPQRSAEEIVAASSGVAFDFAAEDDPRVLERLRTVRDYDVIVVDCPGSLEGTETLAGVLSAATFALIPMIPERAAVQPTLRTAQLCADQGASPRGGEPGGPAQGSGARGVSVVAARRDGDPADGLVRAPLRGAQPEPARRRADHQLPR
jgi:chromosome partitioning protein